MPHTPRLAIRYRCDCRAEYLVAIQGAGDSGWLESVRAAGRGLGIGVVDGSRTSFVCSGCRVTHVRADDTEPRERV